MRQKSTVNVTQKCSMAWLKTSSIQGCVGYTHVEEPSDPWLPTLALSQAENLIFSYKSKLCWTLYMYSTLLFTGSEHWDPFNCPRAQSCCDLNLHLIFLKFMS